MCPEGRDGGPTEEIQSSSSLPLWALTCGALRPPLQAAQCGEGSLGSVPL